MSAIEQDALTKLERLIQRRDHLTPDQDDPKVLSELVAVQTEIDNTIAQLTTREPR